MTSRAGADGEHNSLPESWLEDEDLEERENLERLAGDADLVRTLRKAGFAGLDYEEFRTELSRYGGAVLTGWLKRGAIRGKCVEKRLRGVPEQIDREFDADTARELAYESVARALEPFRIKVLLAGKWDPRKGAALKTYFVGQCLIKFVDVAELWLKHERLISEEVLVLDVDRLRKVRARADVETEALRGQAVFRALSAVERPEARTALALQALQWTAPDIAEHLGMTTKAVEKMIENAKRKLRELA